MSTHTPGPWIVKHNPVNLAVRLADGTYVVENIRGSSWAEEAANAHLIAAAPELLEACRRLLKFNEELCVDVNVSTHYPSADFARAAIAKAEGR